jgi:hypothetical protein
MSMVMKVWEEEGEVESRDFLGEARPRGKYLETLILQEPRHQFKLEYTMLCGPVRERVQRKP